MKLFDYKIEPEKLLTPEIVQMVSCIHEHKGKQELFMDANINELETLLDVALIQSTGASNRIEGIYTTDKRLKELVYQKSEPRNRSEQEISGYREVLSTIHENYEYIVPRPNIILQLHRDLYSYSKGNIGGRYKSSDNVIAETDSSGHQKASSIGWHENKNSYEPFVKYYLGITLKAYNEFENRIEHLKNRSLSKPERIKAMIDNKVGKITKKEIMEAFPDISKTTVERTLADLVKSCYVVKVGSGPATAYARI